MEYYSRVFKQSESINLWKFNKVKARKYDSQKEIINGIVNSSEGYMEVEYPVRRQFLQRKAKEDDITHVTNSNNNNVYFGFENERVDFSSFISTPHVISNWCETFIDATSDRLVHFNLITCGQVILWLNGQKITDFRPFTRNHGTSEKISMALTKGKNHVVVFFEDLAERDVNFFFQLQVTDDTDVRVQIPVEYESAILNNAIAFLDSLYFKKDLYTAGDVIIYSDYKKINKIPEQVIIQINHNLFSELKDNTSGDIATFDNGDRTVKTINGNINIGNVEELKTSGLTSVNICLKLPNDTLITRHITVAVLDQKIIGQLEGATIQARKKNALSKMANLEMHDISVGIAQLNNIMIATPEIIANLKTGFKQIENKGDCADFIMAPLLTTFIKYRDVMPNQFSNDIKNLALNFRYWIDEPGNDVMWYFSENHALLFHTCQYLAGNVFKKEIFRVSNRTGREQYQIGKNRLLKWFNNFFKVGFSEWNSTTYIPIDLIGFLSLYISAPDNDIRMLAKKALDFTFDVIKVNVHSGIMGSTYGRVYEHDLKAMQLGELASIIEVTWGNGYYNNAIRTNVLYCMSDYVPTSNMNILNPTGGKAVLANYSQGINRNNVYVFKNEFFSIASIIDFNSFKRGHQQHVMNVSLGDNATQIWINNPGETAYSGENRPSYWAGNGYCPQIFQDKQKQFIHYQIPENGIKFIHLYIPYWSVDEIKYSDDRVFVKCGESYFVACFSNRIRMQELGPNRSREIICEGSEISVYVECSSKFSDGSFGQFIEKEKNLVIREYSDKVQYSINNDVYTVENNSLVHNNEQIRYNYNYKINPLIIDQEVL